MLTISFDEINSNPLAISKLANRLFVSSNFSFNSFNSAFLAFKIELEAFLPKNGTTL